MPDFTFKNAFFRIFWKILAKTGPQTLYSCGFPEASVEMKVAPFRALTPFCSYRLYIRSQDVEMKVAPFRALTQTSLILQIVPIGVEMKVAPFRALTPFCSYRLYIRSQDVEMKVAPFRALTPFSSDYISHLLHQVEMKVAPFRALTQLNIRFFPSHNK